MPTGRALVTLDLDFSNPLVFPPEKYSGIAVLRLGSKPSHPDLVAVVGTLIDASKREDLAGRLWSVELGRVRIYQPPADHPQLPILNRVTQLIRPAVVITSRN